MTWKPLPDRRRLGADPLMREACAYFRMGLRTGVLHHQSAKDWAHAVVAAMERPPVEIIEIAVANGHDACLEALDLAAGAEDESTTAGRLMGDIADRMRAGGIGPAEALGLASRVADAARLPVEVHADLHALEDELALAIDGMFSSPEAVAQDILAALSQYSAQTGSAEVAP